MSDVNTIQIPLFGQFKLSLYQSGKQPWQREAAIMRTKHNGDMQMVGDPVHFTSVQELNKLLQHAMMGQFDEWMRYQDCYD